MKCPLPKFTSKNFDDCISDRELEDLPFHSGDKRVRSQTDVFAECANALLEARWAKLVEGATEHFMFHQDGLWWAHSDMRLDKDTHRTLIFPSLIEEIEKEKT